MIFLLDCDTIIKGGDDKLFISETERKMYHSVIKKLVFTPCISQSEFIGIIIEQELGIQKLDELSDVITKTDKYGYKECYADEYNRAGKEFKRLLSYLVSNPAKSQSLSNMIRMPKKYDDIMKNWQIKLYNDLTTELNNSTRVGIKFPLIEITISKSSIVEHFGQEWITQNKRTISDSYPYLWFDERDGLNYIECIILINIILTKRNRSLIQLSKLTSRAVDKKTSRDWVQKVIENMRSDDIHRLYVDIFFDKLYNLAVKEYNAVAEDFIKMAWLPEEFLDRKNVFNAGAKHGEWQGDLIFDNLKLKQKAEFMQKLEGTQELSTLINEIIPSAWDRLIQKNKIEKELKYDQIRKEKKVKIYSQKRTQACKHIARKFIRDSIDTSQKILQNFLIC